MPLSLLMCPEFRKFITDYPSHPLVTDVGEKAGLFDEAASLFDVPPMAVVGA